MSGAPGLIDTHCHILPGVDDGPADLESALRLARRLIDSGVTIVCASPHCSSRFPPDLDRLRSAQTVLASSLAERAVLLDVRVWAEIAPAYALATPGFDFTDWSLAGRYALVEITPGLTPAVLMSVLDKVMASDLSPVLAHPERVGAIARDHSLIREVARAGGVIQVVAPSLAGVSGNEVMGNAWKLLDSELVHVVASDAHGDQKRPPLLAEVGREITDQYGAEAWRRLARDNPLRLVHPSQIAQT